MIRKKYIWINTNYDPDICETKENVLCEKANQITEIFQFFSSLKIKQALLTQHAWNSTKEKMCKFFFIRLEIIT